MFTSGWVWLVTDRSGRLGIIPTFGPGTLLIRSRLYMGFGDELALELNPSQQSSFGPYHKAERDSPMTSASNVEMDVDVEDDIRPLRSPTGSPTSPTSPYPSSPVSGVAGGKQPPVPPNTLHPRFLSSGSANAWAKRNSVYKADEKASRPLPIKTKQDLLNLGETLYPLFCISVYEHAWMAAGYGVWGKEAWLKEFWTVLDWQKVSTAYAKFYPDPTKTTVE